MVRAGAVGYVGKDQPAEEVLRAIHRSAEGRASLVVDRLGEVAERLVEQQTRDVVHVAERSRVSADRIEEAIRGDVIHMVFQPVVDLNDGRILGVEALSRFLTKPRRSPETWFAEAAAHGLLARLELATATQALGHLDDIPEGVYLSVNVSPETLRGSRLAELLRSITAQRVVIELTERSPIEDYEEANARLAELRALGCRLAIDDVGKGFSGLAHVVELSPDVLKLDRSLVNGVDADEHRSALIARLSSYADQVGMEVVAEGIETVGELETLRGLGPGAGQGSLLGRPGPIPSIADGTWEWPLRRHPWAVRH